MTQGTKSNYIAPFQIMIISATRRSIAPMEVMRHIVVIKTSLCAVQIKNVLKEH